MSIADQHAYDHAFDDDWDDFEAAVAARTTYSTADFTSRNRAGRWTRSPRGDGRRSTGAGRRAGRTGDAMSTREAARFYAVAQRTSRRTATARAAGGDLYDRWAEVDLDVPARHPLAAADLEEPPEFPLHDTADEPTLRLVEQRRRLAALAGVSRRRWTVAAMIVLVGFAVVLVNVALHTEMARAQFRLTDLSQREAAAAKAYDQKRLEVARLEAPQRIIEDARHAGMVEPAKVTPVRPAPVPAAPDAAPAPAPPAANSQAGWQELKPQLQRGATK